MPDETPSAVDEEFERITSGLLEDGFKFESNARTSHLKVKVPFGIHVAGFFAGFFIMLVNIPKPVFLPFSGVVIMGIAAYGPLTRFAQMLTQQQTDAYTYMKDSYIKFRHRN